MRIKIFHDWLYMDYGCDVEPKKLQKMIIICSFKSVGSSILLSEITKKSLYIIELWGGNGPTVNEFHIVDSNEKAYESFKKFIEMCSQYAEEEEIKKAQEILKEARIKLGL
ncbi:hypothetical protein CW705_09395 [Candidatus Bathyarchaeota archaeon]|nr:MAG: hypothetical protein CW705_09395 [Candidatus Bathyarchaeota archaeon]